MIYALSRKFETWQDWVRSQQKRLQTIQRIRSIESYSNMVRVAEENAVSLAQMAVEETGFGKVADKTYKNHMASTLLYDAIKDMKTIGIISEDPISKNDGCS